MQVDIGNKAASPESQPSGYPPAVSVIVVNYNAGTWLQKCLDSLARQTHADFEAIILDNGSTDGSLESLRLPDRRFSLHPQGRNLGFAAGNNAGARLARGTWLATLNPDAFPEPNWLEELLKATTRHPDTVMFGSTQWMHGKPGVLDGVGDCMSFSGFAWRGGHGRPWNGEPPEGEVFSPCAAAALYRTDVFKEAGGFCEPLFCYFEDVDLGYRLRLMGHRTIQVSKAAVHHVSGGSSDGGGFATFHGHRNAFWVNIINTPWPLLFLTLPSHVMVFALFLFLEFLDALVKAKHKGVKWIRFSSSARALYHGLFLSKWAWRQRAGVQARRKASSFDLIKVICWSPLTLVNRKPYVKKLVRDDDLTPKQRTDC